MTTPFTINININFTGTIDTFNNLMAAIQHHQDQQRQNELINRLFPPAMDHQVIQPNPAVYNITFQGASAVYDVGLQTETAVGGTDNRAEGEVDHIEIQEDPAVYGADNQVQVAVDHIGIQEDVAVHGGDIQEEAADDIIIDGVVEPAVPVQQFDRFGALIELKPDVRPYPGYQTAYEIWPRRKD